MAFQHGYIENNTLCPNKLSTVCLKCIVDNFKHFMAAYESGDSIPRQYFEFLQRTYSVSLLDELLYEDDFEKYIQFLLNPYLKQVNLGRCFDNVVPIVGRLKEIGPTIISLSLAHADYCTNALIELTSFLPNLESLTLGNLVITENVLKNIRLNCQALQTLSLATCRGVTDQCIEAFCFPANDNARELGNSSILQHLDISNTDVTVVGVIHILKNLRGLLSLKHDNVLDAAYNLHFDDMKNNAISSLEKYGLEALTIREMSRYPIEFMEVCVTLFPNLKHIKVYGINTQLQIDMLAKFPLLKEIYLLFDLNTIDLLPFLKSRGKDLEKLRLDSAKISPDSLLKFCTKLKYLEFVYGAFLPTTDYSITALSSYTLQHFKYLTLQGFNFEDDSNTKSAKLLLSCSPNLEVLNLNYSNGLSNEFIKSVILSCHCVNNLKDLNLDFTDIMMSSVEELVLKIPNLKMISLQDSNLSQENISDLQLLKPYLDIQANFNFSDFSNPNEDDFDGEYDYFDYNSDASYDYYDYGDELDDDYYGTFD